MPRQCAKCHLLRSAVTQLSRRSTYRGNRHRRDGCVEANHLAVSVVERLNTVLMPNVFAMLAPLALILPGLPAGSGVDAQNSNLTPEADVPQQSSSQEWLMLEGANGVPVQMQVRIEQRVIIRVSPSRDAQRSFLSTLPQGEQPQEMAERKIGKCVKANQIAGVQPMRDNRLMLFMRDRKLIAANLEKACSARDFYSGFYLEPNKDGQICIDRDKLKSRTGANCEMKRLRQLIPAQS